MQENLLSNIALTISRGRSVLIVGPTNSGKSIFVINTLQPLLEKMGLCCEYFKDCNELTNREVANSAIALVDEVEILSDFSFLASRHPEDSPYYTDSYLQKVALWHQALGRIKNPTVYIVTRNSDEEV